MNRKTVVVAVLTVIFSVMAGLTFSYAFFLKTERAANGVYVEDIHMGGLERQQVKELLVERYSLEGLNMSYGKQQFHIQMQDIEFEPAIEKTLEKVFESGRNGMVEYISHLFGKDTVLKMESSYDEKLLDNAIEEVSSKISKPARNAQILIVEDMLQITPDEKGVDVDKNILKRRIKEVLEYKKSSKDVEIPVKSFKASIEYDDVKGIDTLLGSFSTRYNQANWSRSENLRVASQSISNRVVMPGEVFSMNEETGKRSIQNGYKMAPVIVKGKLEEGLGGGVCQVSSTLYNAVIRSGLEIVERRNHSIPSSYIGIGLDATVSYGSIDFKFENNFENPVYVYIKPARGRIEARIYGVKSDKKNISINAYVMQRIPRQIQVKWDDQLKEGEQVVEEKGRDGYKVKTYRSFWDKDGKLIERQTLSSDYYPPMEKILVNGTGKKEQETDQQIQTKDTKIHGQV